MLTSEWLPYSPFTPSNRIISLKTHASKTLTTIFYKRIEQTIESSLKKDNFCFRKVRRTREALLSLQLIQNGRLRVEEQTFIALVDLEKVFDKVSWPKFFEILKNEGIKYKDKRIIGSLFEAWKAVVEIQGERREASIRKGVKHIYSLSSPLFCGWYWSASKCRKKTARGVFYNRDSFQQ